MINLKQVAESCAIIIKEEEEGITHLATAWSIGNGEWISAWGKEAELPENLSLIIVETGEKHKISSIETDGGLIGFNSVAVKESLVIEIEGDLSKYDELEIIGFPCVINHPEIMLSVSSITHKEYYPYLCPWFVSGNLVIFGRKEGFCSGQAYTGMNGSPVFNKKGKVVGVVASESKINDSSPTLIKFHRLQ